MSRSLKSYGICDSVDREAHLRLINLHKTMSPEDRQWIMARGFQIVVGAPPANAKTPYFVMIHKLGWGMYYGAGPHAEDSFWGTIGIPSLKLQPATSLAGLVEQTMLDLKAAQEDEDVAKSNSGQPVIIYLNSKEYAPITRILAKRYPASKKKNNFIHPKHQA